MINWGDAAKRINAVFENHGIPPIQNGEQNWAPILADNIEKLAARLPPDWATHYAEIVEMKQHTFRRWKEIPPK